MADLDVTVSATGARQADGELAKLQQTTSRASDAAKRLRKETSASPAVMSRHAAAASQAAEGNRKIAQTADQAQRAIRGMSSVTLASRAAQSLGRFGGQFGGVAGRIGGALQSGASVPGGASSAAGTSIIALGVTAAAAGVALQVFTAYAERAGEAAKRMVELQQKAAEVRKNATSSADSLGVGAVDKSRDAITALAGISPDLAKFAVDRAGKRGPDYLSIGSTIARAGFSKPSDLDKAFSATQNVERLGFGDAAQAAKLIAENPGLMKEKPLQMQADIASLLSGRNVQPQQFQALMDNVSRSPEALRAIQLQSEGRATDGAALNRGLTSSTAITGIQAGRNQITDPAGSAMSELKRQLLDTAQALSASAEAQGRIAGAIQQLKFPFGGSTPIVDQALDAYGAAASLPTN